LLLTLAHGYAALRFITRCYALFFDPSGSAAADWKELYYDLTA
jgi:hypothetical protein